MAQSSQSVCPTSSYGGGLAISIPLEWLMVHVFVRWTYTPQMPLIPGVRVGMTPVAQMLVLPPLVFCAVTMFLGRNAPGAHM